MFYESMFSRSKDVSASYRTQQVGCIFSMLTEKQKAMLSIIKLAFISVVVLLAFTSLGATAQTRVLVPQAGHSSSVNAVAFSPDRKMLASGSDDGTILLWDLETGSQLRALAGHAAPVMSVLFSPDGKIIASMANNGSVIVWDLRTGEKRFSIEGNYLGSNSISFSPDGKILAYTGYGDKTQRISGSAARSVAPYFLDLQTGNSIRLSNEFFSPKLPIAFSPDGKTLAFVENDTLRLLDVKERKSSKSLVLGIAGSLTTYLKPRPENYPAGVPDYMKKGTRITYAALEVTLIAFSSDSTNLIVVATGSGSSRLQRAHALMVVNVSRNTKDVPLAKRLGQSSNCGVTARFMALSSNNVFAIAEDFLAFSPDGYLLAAGRKTGQICLSDIASDAKPILTQDFSGGMAITRHGGKSIFVAPSGKLFMSGRDDASIELWNTKTGTKFRSLSAEAQAVRAIAFSPDGTFLASAGIDNEIALYNTTEGRYVQTFTLQSEGETAITIGNGDFTEEKSGALTIKQILGRNKNGKSIKIVKMNGDNVESDIPPDDSLRAIIGTVTNDIEISPDSRMLASGGDDQIVRVWDLRSGRRLHTLVGHTNIVSSVVFSPDSKTLASSGDDKTIKLWDTATGVLLRTLRSDALGHVLAIAFSPDGRTLASGDDNRLVSVWNLATGDQLLRLLGSTGNVYQVSFGLDGKTLYTASNDNTVNLWDAASGAKLNSFKGRVADNKRAVLSPNGRVMVIGREDGRIAFLNAGTSSVLGYLIPLTKSDWLTATLDGLFDGTPSAMKKMIWRAVENTLDFLPAESFFNEFYYPSLLTEIMAGKRPLAPRNFADLDRRQPDLKLSSSMPANASDARNITVKIEVTEAIPDEKHTQRGSGAQDVRLFRNGSLIKVWRGDVLRGRNSVSLEVVVPIVAGENRIAAYAFNRDNIKSSDATLVINGADSLKRAGVVYVLSVGVNEYANSQYDLKYAVADAKDFAEEIKRQQAKLNNYERVELISLHDKDATKANILKSLDDLATRVQAEDVLVILFAGHGTAQQNRFYLIPHDLGYRGNRTQLDSAALQSILSHSISDEEIEGAVENIDVGHLLLVIDACNSGQALEAEEKRRGPMNSKGLAQLAYEKGMYILTAAQSYQAAQEVARLGHGFLTYALVEEGLRTNAADKEPQDGQVLLREWLDYATERVPKMQQEELDAQKSQGRELQRKKVETNATFEGIQRPRVFYRRETELHQFVVTRP